MADSKVKTRKIRLAIFQCLWLRSERTSSLRSLFLIKLIFVWYNVICIIVLRLNSIIINHQTPCTKRLHTIALYIRENANFTVREFKIQNYIFRLIFSALIWWFGSSNYSGMSVEHTNQWLFFLHFFHPNIWSVHMTQRNTKTAENNDHYGELLVRIRKKNTHTHIIRFRVLSKSLTIKYNETCAPHLWAIVSWSRTTKTGQKEKKTLNSSIRFPMEKRNVGISSSDMRTTCAQCAYRLKS